jgi:predicted N-acyltransferase
MAGGHAVSLPPATVLAPRETAVSVTRATALQEIDVRTWDELVPLDLPHLRAGFLRAVEESGFGHQPHYFCAWRGGELAGIAVAYAMPVDLLTLAPPKYTRWINALRNRLAPGLLFLSTMSCGPMITNCNPSFCLAADLSPEEQEEVIEALLESVEATPLGCLICAFEFPEAEAARYEGRMAARGWLKAPSLPGTRLPITFRSLDEYVAQMRKAFRRTVLKDRRAGAGLDFAVVDDFSGVAEDAWRLYANVLARADHVFEKLTPEFFRALAKFEQSRLVTARERATGRLVGIELLLCGETVLQDLYTGLDEEFDPKQRVYFNLLYPVIEYAAAQGFEALSLGQTSYQFKARLGAQPYPLFLFIKHRNRFIHRVIAALRPLLFPETRTTTYRVFRDAGP